MKKITLTLFLTILLIAFAGCGKKGNESEDTIKYGIIITIIVSLVITLIFEVFAKPISYLFALTLDESSLVSKNDVISTCQTALHIASIGYIFMGFNVAIQGILQGFNKVMSPLIISILRLVIFLFPFIVTGSHFLTDLQ